MNRFPVVLNSFKSLRNFMVLSFGLFHGCLYTILLLFCIVSYCSSKGGGGDGCCLYVLHCHLIS
jgi:hypothetical protein